MVNGAIHRVIEQQAAMQPDAVAIVDGTRTITYRELNQRANTLARRLGDSGLARGGHAFVRMDPSLELATLLLAVLKAGAAYTWVESGSRASDTLPSNFCIAPRTRSSERFLALDIRNALEACASHPSANLPILTRGSDIACVLPDAQETAQVLVPHETITSMPVPPRRGGLMSHPGAFDLWIALMSGETVAINQPEGMPVATQAA